MMKNRQMVDPHLLSTLVINIYHWDSAIPVILFDKIIIPANA